MIANNDFFQIKKIFREYFPRYVIRFSIYGRFLVMLQNVQICTAPYRSMFKLIGRHRPIDLCTNLNGRSFRRATSQRVKICAIRRSISRQCFRNMFATDDIFARNVCFLFDDKLYKLNSFLIAEGKQGINGRKSCRIRNEKVKME